MVPLIGRLKILDELLAYVLRFLPCIVPVQKALLVHKVPRRFASFLLSKQRFSLLYSPLGINYSRLASHYLAATKRLCHRALYVPKASCRYASINILDRVGGC
jgi:hypothetical protein